ncbi:MAG: carboxypeptidase-like regulatory domain-containing protein [Cyclobacteriaceae bacterium]
MKNKPKPRRNTVVFLMQIALISLVVTPITIGSSYALAAVKSSSLTAFQGIQVSGTITDDQGVPIPGANIIEKGTTNGVASDSDGKYSLLVNNGDAILVFSFIGYTSQEVPLNGRTSLEVSMAADLQTLQEVVVVGYGTQLKKDLTGSVSNSTLLT